MTHSDAAKCLDYESDSVIIQRPVRSDGSHYSIEFLQTDQKKALAEVLNFVRQYCEGRCENSEQLLRLTVAGVAGSGKSTWINTLVSTLRKMFPNDHSVSVFAPTGSAAFNAGGETIHRGFGMSSRGNVLELDAIRSNRLISKFRTMMVLIFDERSMIDAETLAIVQKYMQEYAHGGNNTNHPWGGIPIIIFVGDNFQLPPIFPGAIYSLNEKEANIGSDLTPEKISLRSAGFAEFRALGGRVIKLVGEKRVNPEQATFRRILRALRCENEKDVMTEGDANRLLKLHLSHSSFSEKERRAIMSKATYVFANREPRDKLNAKMLHLLNNSENPVAMIKSLTTKKGQIVSNNKHFDQDRTPSKVLLCRNARVSLNGINPNPKIGLYHGSLGIVRDIVYESGTSPQTGHFPAYVLVEFHQYCGEAVVKDMPRCIPITPQQKRCNKGCCIRTYLPLTLAYGKTAHTFQGQNVGPLPPNRPQNAIQKIIIDPGTRSFEGKNCGLLYTCAGRGTTMGEEDDKLSSAIYFDGPHFCRSRFENLTMGANKALYKKARLRKEWVAFLNKNTTSCHRWTDEKMIELFNWANNTTIPNLKMIVDRMKQTQKE